MKYTLSLVLSLCMATLSQADTSAPLFAGSTLSIQGDTYTWTSATEDSTWHYDTYTDASSQTVTVKGLLGGSSWAMVSGPGTATTISGHIQNGEYDDNQLNYSLSGTWVVNGVTYTHRDVNLTVYENLDAGLNYFLDRIGHDNYTGPDGNQTNTYYGYGQQSQQITNGKVPQYGLTSLSVLGGTYNFTSSSSYFDYGSDYSDYGKTDVFTNASGGTVTLIKAAQSGDITFDLMHVQAWDPYFGSLTTASVFYSSPITQNLSGWTWQPRSAPLFAKPQLTADGMLLNWQSGTTGMDGTITDTYTCGGLTMTISMALSNYHAFTSGTSAASVVLSGTASGTGTVNKNGIFSMAGHTLEAVQNNHSVPFFTGTTTQVTVNGSIYTFSGGYQDSSGNRVDVFTNSTLGSLSIAGVITDAAHGTVRVSRFGAAYSGTFTSGSFSVNSPAHITVSAGSASSTELAPPGIRVRGLYYARTSSTSATYHSAISGGDTITLGGSTSAPVITGTSFSGTSAADAAGVFMLQDTQGASTVPVVWANSDGVPHLSYDAPPTGLPPALVAQGGIWVYIGTATEDTNTATNAPLAAYYCSTALDSTSRLIKLRLDGSATSAYTVIFTDYSTGVSTTGSYSAQTHLFQSSAASSGFPMPVYGVDPAVNYALWAQTLPDSSTGLPATFLVNGEVWRYSGTDSATGNALYQGYYGNSAQGTQLLMVSTPDPVTHLRTITVTDPIEGNGTPTQGTLSSTRGSARMSDGSEVYSGSFAGQQFNPQLNSADLFSISSDLDVAGNVITFGALSGSSATAGATLQYQDTFVSDSITASLYSILARSQAQWQWSRASTDGSWKAPVPVMKLDASSKLTLYDHSSGAAGVILDPTPGGTSTIRGVLRVRPGGDIDMGDFTAGGEP